MAETILADARATFEGVDYHLVFDWGAIEWFEVETDLSFGEFLIQLSLAAAGAAPIPKLGLMAQFVRSGLRRHHPKVSSETAFRLWNDGDVQRQVLGAANKALPKGERRAAAKKGSTRAKRAGASPRHGAKRANG